MNKKLLYTKSLIKNKFVIGFFLFLVVILFFSQSIYKNFLTSKNQVTEEVDITFDSEGPYALLIPRRDGNALILNLKRTSSYDKITYELAYNAEEIDRGVMGEVKTDEKGS